MASIIIMDGLLQQMLAAVLNGGISAATVYVRLYTNNHTPAAGDSCANYTESVAGGYSPIGYTSGTWTVGNVTTGQDRASNSTATYTFTGGDTIYGYYVSDLSFTTLYWAQLFDTPVTIPSMGGVITFTPAIDLETPIP